MFIFVVIVYETAIANTPQIKYRWIVNASCISLADWTFEISLVGSLIFVHEALDHLHFAFAILTPSWRPQVEVVTVAGSLGESGGFWVEFDVGFQI